MPGEESNVSIYCPNPCDVNMYYPNKIAPLSNYAKQKQNTPTHDCFFLQKKQLPKTTKHFTL